MSEEQKAEFYPVTLAFPTAEERDAFLKQLREGFGTYLRAADVHRADVDPMRVTTRAWDEGYF